jgi:hypothetical protein
MVESQRTTHSKLTNLPAEHYFGGLDYSIRRKRNATVSHHSGVIMLKRNRTVKWIKQKSKVAQKVLIKKGSVTVTTVNSSCNFSQLNAFSVHFDT